MTQISAQISDTTRTLFESYSKTSGQKKDFIIEQALLYYLKGAKDLPRELFIPPSITVSEESYDRIVDQAPKPTGALTDLLR